MKGQRVNLNNANISKLERVMNCLQYLKATETVVKKQMINFVALLIGNKLKRMYEKKKTKFDKSKVQETYS
tara:strand:+ start:734 stop:946 length:213 start_codon:yes stop_codon:yes gene_type:complete